MDDRLNDQEVSANEAPVTSAVRQMTATGEKQLDQRLVKALGHPLRQRLLILLHKYGESSPRELALRSGEPLGNVSYHVRILRENDCVELVRTEPRRGAVEHFYRATARPFLDDTQWAQLPASVRRALFGQTLREVWDDVVAAAAGKGLDDPQAHVSRTWFELDDTAWKEMAEALSAVLEKGFELQAESSERAAKEPDTPTRKAAMGLMLFERIADAPEPGRKSRRRRR
jgi:DNA-binding transcriptional ArsR family regulator